MQHKPRITLDFPKNRIRLLYSSLRLLHFPDYVRLLVNPMQGIIALQISDSHDMRAQRLIGRYEKTKDRIDLHSKELMGKIKLFGEWDMSKAYRFEGVFHPEEGMIVYPIPAPQDVQSGTTADSIKSMEHMPNE